MNRTLEKALLLLFAAGLPVTASAAATEGPVVRPQRYSTADSTELSLVVGYVTNDPYNRVIVPGISGIYRLDNHRAIEVHGGYGIYSDKDLLDQVRQKIGRDPNLISRPQWFLTGNYLWTPLYGKINAFAEVVLHYDLYVLAGAGLTGDEVETNSAGTPSVKTVQSKIFPVTDFAIGQHFFLSRSAALRIEFRPYIFWEQIDGKWDPNADVQLLTGLSYLF